MNDFFLYKQLCFLERIADQYTEGKSHCEHIRRTAEQIASQTYRVAVIGEFKRGKSSLINALLGAKILPTDILPMTAAVTRVVYGVERKIVIHYRDGHQEERTLEELFDYATKFDKEKEQVAQTVREIVVSYPSVLCKNHIQLLDTPGLNDNESMSAVTLSVIGDVDAAIVVTSAKQAMSISEQQLVLDLIAQPGVRHIIFVATFIDQFEDEEEKDHILAYILARLKEQMLGRAEESFKDKPELLKKARNILTSPDLFGVSSRQAMKGFVNNDQQLLKESRLPHFKEELLACLTAAQSADLPYKTKEEVELVARQLPLWMQVENEKLVRQMKELQREKEGRERYLRGSWNALMEWFQQMERDVEATRKEAHVGSEDIKEALIQPFVKELGALKEKDYTDAGIRAALQRGTENACLAAHALETCAQNQVKAAMDAVTDRLQEMREAAGLQEDALRECLRSWEQSCDIPKFRWVESPIPPVNKSLVGVNVIEAVRLAVDRSEEQLEGELDRHIGTWRVAMMNLNKKERQELAPLSEAEERLQKLQAQEEALLFNFEQHRQQVEDICTSLREETRQT